MKKQVISVLVRSFEKVFDVLTGTEWHQYHKYTMPFPRDKGTTTKKKVRRELLLREDFI